MMIHVTFAQMARLFYKGFQREDRAMIEWGSANWGGHVHYASNGSWVGDKHDKAKAKEGSKSKGSRKSGKDAPEQD